MLSIIKRKDALGLLAHSDLEERFTKTKSEIEALIQIAFGGMVAEELFFGEAGTGPAGDLQAATTAARPDGRLARHGRLADLLRRGRPWRAAATSWPRCSPTTTAGTRSRSILDDAKADGRPAMLDDHRHVVEALRDALLERDELIGDEILDVIRRGRGRRPSTCGPSKSSSATTDRPKKHLSTGTVPVERSDLVVASGSTGG